VRDEIRKGVEIIKLFATGGHGVPGSKHRMEMTRDELAAAIETAHSRDVLVRAHLAGKEPIMTAIELGIDIVDHCDDMDDEVIAALAETGTFVVPSVLYPKVMAESMASTNPAGAAEIESDLAFMYDALPKAEAAGVHLLLGDDYGAPGLDHGTYGRELRLYVEDAGLSPLTVIGWATRNAAALLGRSDDLGSVEVGKRADLLVLDGDPSVDIGVLADTCPRAVLVDGRVVAGSLEAT
jgi:imidazolonepropionase-like amidohydrolase